MSSSTIRCIVLACLLIAGVARAETIPFEQKPSDKLANHDMCDSGGVALGIRPDAWLHGETPDWIIHFRRITEAKRVALEIDSYFNFVAKFLGASPDQLVHKAHVFIFEDEKDWKEFMSKATQLSSISPLASSFAYGGDLFLNIRAGNTGVFDSDTLAHETTHAVVARVYPRHHEWPLWLNEGFAEEMSGRSVGARMGQFNQRALQRSQAATLTLDQLFAVTTYPTEALAKRQFYKSAEKAVHFMMTDAPADRFPKLLETMMNGEDFPAALGKLYADKYPTYDAFKKRYAQLAR